jgi:hypothetical protein
MAISHVASAAGSTSNPTVTDQVTLSASIQAGDFLEVWVHNRYADQGVVLEGVTDNDSGGNTWAKKGESANGRLSLWWKIATSGTASKVVTATVDQSAAVIMGYSAYRSDAGGFDADSITNLAFENNASGNESQAGFTPDAADSLIGLAVATMNDVTHASQACTDPGALTERFQKLSSAAQDHALTYSSALQSGGPTATGTFTWSHSNVESDSGVHALKEAAASGTNYDETGKQITITSTVAGTSQYGMTEALDVAATATIGGSDQLDAVEDLAVTASATVEATDQLDAVDSHQVAITSTVTGSDGLSYDETGKQISITSTVAGTSQYGMTEALELAASATISGSDQQDAVEDLAVTATATIEATDQLNAVDSHQVAITSTVTGSDVADFTESLNLEIVSTVTGSDVLGGAAHYDETGRQVNIAATVSGSDVQGHVEDLTFTAIATVAGSDAADFTETLGLAIASTVSGSDQKGGVEHAELAATATIGGSGQLDAVEDLAVTATVTISLVDVAALLEELELSILATVSGTDTQGLAIAGAVEAGQAGGSSASSGSGATGPEAGHNVTRIAAGGLLVGSVEGG